MGRNHWISLAVSSFINPAKSSPIGVPNSTPNLVSALEARWPELAPFRITVNCISPAVYTRMTDSLMEVDQSTLEQRASRVPLGWFGQPEDVAPAFVFFACNDADYITGQVLAVDGGSTL